MRRLARTSPQSRPIRREGVRGKLAAVPLVVTLGLLATLSPTWGNGLSAQEGAEARVREVLDDLHRLASEADFDAYFALYTDDAVFLGTDATERWSLDDFKAYARPVFDQGRGWTYTATERHVFLSADGGTAWFDERLTNENLGETRGTGVLVIQDGRWRLAQYNLTIPIPNELARDVVRQIRAATGGR